MAVERHQVVTGTDQPEWSPSGWRASLAEAIAATFPPIGPDGAWVRDVLPSMDEVAAIEAAASLIGHPSTPPARRWEAMLDVRRRTDGLLRLCLVARSLLIATEPETPGDEQRPGA